MSSSPLASRTLTLLASGFLGFDGAVLLALGWWSGRAGFAVAGAVLLLSSGLVLAYWRRHLRRLDEIAATRRALRDEADSLRRLLGG